MVLTLGKVYLLSCDNPRASELGSNCTTSLSYVYGKQLFKVNINIIRNFIGRLTKTATQTGSHAH